MAKRYPLGYNIDNDIRNLIIRVTDLKPDVDSENILISQKYALSVIYYHRFLDVIPVDVWAKSNRYYERFKNHAEYKKANVWKTLTELLKSQTEVKDHQPVSSVLFLLMKLSHLGTSFPTVQRLDSSISVDQKECKPKELSFSDDETETQHVPFNDESESESLTSWSDNEDELDQEDNLAAVSTDSGTGISPDAVPDSGGHFHNGTANCDVDEPKASNHSDWLKSHVVQPYWKENYFIASSYADFQNQKIPFVILEHVLMTEIIWMLHGDRNTFLFQWDGKRFHLRRGTSLADIPQEALESICESVCECSSFMVDLQGFWVRCTELDTTRVQQAFAHSLRQALRPFSKELLDIEKELINQETTLTLLMMLDRLTPWLHHVKLLFNLLHVGVLNRPLEACSPSSQAMHILHTIYLKLVEEDNTDGNRSLHFRTLFTVFLDTCKPFLDFLEQLLNEGKIDDSHHEFIIERASSENNGAQNSADQLLLPRMILRQCQEDFFLFKIISQVILTAKLVIMLTRLQNAKPIEDGSFDTLSTKFTAECHKEFHLFDMDSSKRPESPDLELPLATVSRSFLSNADPLLRANFNKIFPIVTHFQEKKPEKIVISELPEFSDLQRKVDLRLECILSQLVSEKCETINRRAMELLKGDLCIKDHLQAIRNYFLFEAGENMKDFASEILRRIVCGKSWKSATILNQMFKTFTNNVHANPKHLNNLSLTVSKKSAPPGKEKLLDELDALCLKYSAPSPINIILNHENQSVYNKIFCFLMKLNSVKSAFDNLRFNDLDDPINPRKSCPAEAHLLHLLRLDLMYFINELHRYFMFGVLQGKQQPFLHALDTTESFHSALLLHQGHIKELQQFCLLSSSCLFLNKFICILLNILLCFASNWHSQTIASGVQKMVLLKKDFYLHIWALSRALTIFRNDSYADITKVQFADLGNLSKIISSQTNMLPKKQNPIN